MSCEICGRGSCTRSFHSLAAQEEFDNPVTDADRIAELEEQNFKLETELDHCRETAGKVEDVDRANWELRQEVVRLSQAALRLAQDNTMLESHIKAIAEHHFDAIGEILPTHYHIERRDFALSIFKD